jgi:iron complex transport system permease protein
MAEIVLNKALRWTNELRFRLLMPLCVIGVVFSITIAVSVGAADIAPIDVWRIAGAKIGLLPPGDWTLAQEQIVWLIRFPRVLLAACIGAGLAVVGVTMQALVRNTLADPYLLGISSGASVGAVGAIALGLFAFAGLYAVSLGAFVGSLLALAIVFLFARRYGQLAPQRLILAGLAVSYVFTGVTSFITLTSDNRQLAGQILSWTLGSLGRASWFDLTLPTLLLVCGAGYLLTQARSLNALIAGDETAATLGLDLQRFRRTLFIITALLTGVMVAVSGSIGFVGLMVPHITRLLVGSDHHRVLPLSLAVGSIFLIWVDLIARTIVEPTELPVGVVTALIGGPFFLWLMWREQQQE